MVFWRGTARMATNRLMPEHGTGEIFHRRTNP
jgi:hypothetical protein